MKNLQDFLTRISNFRNSVYIFWFTLSMLINVEKLIEVNRISLFIVSLSKDLEEY